MKIVFDQVDKKFGIVNALKDISFEIDQGEFVFITGNSGAGKSTLLKLILNQLKPSSGKILLGDVDLSLGNKDDINNTRRKIGVVFQDYQLISDKTIEENIALILDIVNYPKEKIQSRIDQVIKEVNLGTRRFLFPSQLAGGELQRAALARALAIEPEVILADEPTGNLDPENSWNLVKLLKEINQKNNTTIIMTTHNNDIVESMGKRVIKLKEGELV
ncbi:MAG: ATP-binding cassette domain-containing protein [Candidatus Shapirobacteria bacterium]|nr:ATP-binding cassette domain-containing protein [Candidatus Shapirobacteria bacterium]MDD4410575.1 ATP-binding cassette domain-containing protein [Candidatus Shapirobacteria bacterium]